MEFALLAPVALLLLFGIVVVGIVVTNQVQLSNAARDAARAAAICGGARGYTYDEAVAGTVTVTSGTTTLPNGQLCTFANLKAYITSRLNAIPGGGSAVSTNLVVCPTDLSCLAPSPQPDPKVLDECSRGEYVEVTMSFNQPLFLPLVGTWLATPSAPSNTRTLTSTAEAICEQ